jgi:Tfp pilus assembly protein PilO
VKRSDRTVVVGVALFGVALAFWVLVLGPKRQEASDLSKQVTELQASVDQQEQLASFAEHAKSGFGRNYHRLVVLGKAVPEDSDQASLLVQLNQLAGRSGVSFRALALEASAVAATPATTPTPAAPGAPASSATSTDVGSTATSTTPAPATGGTETTGATSSTATPTSTAVTGATVPPATEATAALTPLGAGVGPAGLPVMPYSLTFEGGFFQIADFLHKLDSLVHVRHGQVSVNGRLLTVDSFTLTVGGVSDPGTAPAKANQGRLAANLAVTTYLTPADQGLTGGATPTGPVTAAAPISVPTSATTTTPTTTP